MAGGCVVPRTCAAGRAGQGREGHRRRHRLVWHGRRGRQPDAQLDWHHHRPVKYGARWSDYSLKIYCGDQYPDKVRFVTCINLSCVANNGVVDPMLFHVLSQWQRHYNMEMVLTEVRREMAQPPNRKVAQPPEGATY